MANKVVFSPGNLVLIEDFMMGRHLILCIVLRVNICMRIGLQMRDLVPEFQIILFLVEVTRLDLVLYLQIFTGVLAPEAHLCSLQGAT